MYFRHVAILLLSIALGLVSGASFKQQKDAVLGSRGQVVFLGDSITDAWDSDGLATYNQFYAPLGTVNTGVSGDRTSTIIMRINEQGIINDLNAYQAVLKIGTNDLAGGVSEAEVVNNIGVILDLIKAKNPNCRILLLGILPRTGVDISTRIRTVNAQIATYADNRSVFFLNMEPAFSQQLGVVDPALFTDGLHLTARGYEVWAEQMNPLFNEILHSPFTGKAVWFGDSITQGWNGNGQAVWAAKYADLTSSNFGIGGHVTTQTIARIRDENVLNGHNAKIAVLKIGTNDLGGNSPVETVAANIRTIIDLILERQPHIRILLLGILPRNGVDIANRIDAVNAIISTYANGDKVRYLDMKDEFQLAIGQVDPELFYDGLHLTAQGYQKWADTMDSLFQELLQFNN